jgi:hypothetical protein
MPKEFGEAVIERVMKDAMAALSVETLRSEFGSAVEEILTNPNFYKLIQTGVYYGMGSTAALFIEKGWLDYEKIGEDIVRGL